MGTGKASPGAAEAHGVSGDAEFGVEEAYDVFPSEIVKGQADGQGDGENAGDEMRDRKIEKASNGVTERTQHKRKGAAVETQRDVAAREKCNVKNVPQAPEIGYSGHGEDDDAFDGNGQIAGV